MADKKCVSVTAWLYDLGARIQFRPSLPFGVFNAKERKTQGSISSYLLPYKKKVKLALSKMAEQSAILVFLHRLIERFFAMRVRSFGVFFFTSGFFQILLYFLAAFFPFFSVGEENLIFGVTQIFLTLLCSFARGGVADALRHSFLFRSVLNPFFGLQEWQIPSGKGRDNLFSVFVLGVCISALTLFISPVRIALFVLQLALVCYIFFAPEAGLSLCLAGTVFLSLEALAGLVLVTLISFLFKCSVGKRSLVFSPMDLPVLLFLLPLSSDFGVFSVFALFFLYFLSSCLIRSVSNLGRLLTSFCAFSVLGALLLVLRQILTFFFAEAFVRTPQLDVVFFVTPTEEYGLVFAMAIPLTLGLMRSASTGGKRFLRFASFLLQIGSLFLIRSSAVWVAAMIGMMIYCLFSYRSSLILMCFSGLGLTLLMNVLPTALLRSVLNVFGMNESSLHIDADTKHSFLHFLQDSGGAIWVVLFFFVLGLFLYEIIHFCTKTTRPEVHLRVLGVLCSVAVFFSACVQSLLPDYRALTLFVILLALPRSAFRCAVREEIRLLY